MTVAVAKAILKVAVLIDIMHRPASQMRDLKWVWTPVVVVIDSAWDWLCGSHTFVFGLRQPRSLPDWHA
jgi:hypothetical protein